MASVWDCAYPFDWKLGNFDYLILPMYIKASLFVANSKKAQGPDFKIISRIPGLSIDISNIEI